MAISFDIPADIEQSLRREHADLDAVAKEAAMVELYRQGAISHAQLSVSLALSRDGTDGILKKHGVTEGTPSLEEMQREWDAIDQGRLR